MKPKATDLKWLPPAQEWDFRSVTVRECRVACHWEYEREKITSKLIQSGAEQTYCPAIYRQAARELFPEAWTTLTKEQREKVLATFFPIPVLQVRKLGEFLKRMPKRESNPTLLRSYLEDTYVIIPHFRLYGVEVLIRELEKWARKEARQYLQSRRAQAADPPFDALKWLAVARLDKTRRKAGVTINNMGEAVKAYRQLHPRPNPNDVFPAYASDGAWLTARNNAHKCMTKSCSNPAFLLAELAW